MKPSFFSKRRGQQAFTLTEALIVLFAVFVLLALILPVWGPRRPVKIMEARVEISQIAAAIEQYRNVYGRYPVPTNVEFAAMAAKEDFTCGGQAIECHSWAGKRATSKRGYDGRPHGLNQQSQWRVDGKW